MENQEKPKRKTHTSNEVIRRYQQKTYQQYALKLRKVEDADIIAMIDAERAKGYQTSEAIKNLIRNKWKTSRVAYLAGFTTQEATPTNEFMKV